MRVTNTPQTRTRGSFASIILDYDKAARVRSKVESLGIRTRVEVKLHDKTKLCGQISRTDSESFMWTIRRAGILKYFILKYQR